MKIQLLKKHNTYYLRKYAFGFIPLYWDRWESCWGFSRWPLTLGEAEETLNDLMIEAEKRRTFSQSKLEIIKETEI